MRASKGLVRLTMLVTPCEYIKGLVSKATLICHNTLKYGTFGCETLKYSTLLHKFGLHAMSRFATDLANSIFQVRLESR